VEVTGEGRAPAATGEAALDLAERQFGERSDGLGTSSGDAMLAAPRLSLVCTVTFSATRSTRRSAAT
jgi:hypothetical protein